MSLSPFVSFQLRFVTYLLTFPRISMSNSSSHTSDTSVHYTSSQ